MLFGALVLNDALSYHTNFPTLGSRENFAQAFGHNASLAAIIGPARRINTIGGFVAWRMLGLLIIIGAIWGLLTATRLLRKEEDAGRWELLLAGRTTRRHATVQAIAGLAAGWIVLWAVTSAMTVAAGLSPTVGFSAFASLFYATAATASAAMFLAIGALTSQLAATRRQANGLAAAVFAVSFLIRMVADSVSGLAWMRWASPLGWVENVRPLTRSQPLALVPVVLLVVVAAGLAVTLAGRRDVGAAVLTRHESVKAHTRLLGTPALLAIRLERFLFIAALVAFAAAGQISAMRSEEADGQLDNLLARHLNRGTWIAGRLGFAAALVLGAGLAAGLGGWIGVATRQSDIGFAAMLQAALNVMAPALFVLGLGALLYGLVPRLAAPLLYALVLWSFLIEIVGANITTNHLLLDTALLSHLGPVPAASLNWTAIAWLTGLGVLATLAGLPAFERRDLAAA